MELFQFTPLREGRPAGSARICISPSYFNSRPYARGDMARQNPHLCTKKISIHAPTRGATRIGGGLIPPSEFQFTPLREGRPPWRPGERRKRAYFNSRPYARGDSSKAKYGQCTLISIHAPTRGATVLCEPHYIKMRDFNSRPYARGDWRTNEQFNINPLFQFTPLREGRRRRKGD